MSYFLFKMNVPDELKLIKHLELLEVYDAFKPAKAEAKRLRVEQPLDGVTYKVMFAENQLAAEESLQEKREKSVLMEYER
jgi:hypothetical protein